MTTLAELARRLERLEAEVALRALVAAYAEACDEHDMPRLLDLFTADAEFASPSGLMAARGREAIGAMFVRLFRVRGPAFHWTHDAVIRPDPADPDRATGRIYAHAETSPGGTHALAAMRYDDVYRREGGRWRFARRSLAFLYYVPVGEYPGVLARRARLAAGARRLPADYPEGLPAWEAFAAAHGDAALGPDAAPGPGGAMPGRSPAPGGPGPGPAAPTGGAEAAPASPAPAAGPPSPPAPSVPSPSAPAPAGPAPAAGPPSPSAPPASTPSPLAPPATARLPQEETP